MRTSTVIKALAATIGLLAVLRQRREAARVRNGQLRPLGSSGRTEEEDVDADRGPVHRRLGSWQPRRPRTALGRGAAAVWAAPLTALGLGAVLAGGTVPRWDPDLGTFVAMSVRGPVRWFLRQQGATAATLGHVVVVRDADASATLLAHESLHARQQERLGLAFGLAYPLAGAVWGYRNNPFEVAARRAARATRLNGPSGPS